MDLFARRDPQIVEFVSHPVGKYGEGDRGGLFQILIEEELKDYIDNFVIRRVEAALTPRPLDGYDAIKEASYIFLALLARPNFVAVRKVIERSIEGEGKLLFFREKFLPFCQLFLFNAVKGHMDVRNADRLVSFVVGEMRFLWDSEFDCLMKTSVSRWKTIDSIRNKHVDRPDSEKKKDKNTKNTERTARKQEYANRKFRGDPDFNNFDDFECTKKMVAKNEKAEEHLSLLHSLYTDPEKVSQERKEEVKLSDTAHALSFLNQPSSSSVSTVCEDDDLSAFIDI